MPLNLLYRNESWFDTHLGSNQKDIKLKAMVKKLIPKEVYEKFLKENHNRPEIIQNFFKSLNHRIEKQS